MRFLIVTILSVLMFFSVSLPVHAADLETGAQVFDLHCAGCHANGGNIIRRGKSLKQPALEKNGYATLDAIAEIVTNGKANMSAYRDKLSAEEIEAVAAYVLDRAANNWK